MCKLACLTEPAACRRTPGLAFASVSLRRCCHHLDGRLLRRLDDSTGLRQGLPIHELLCLRQKKVIQVADTRLCGLDVDAVVHTKGRHSEVALAVLSQQGRHDLVERLHPKGGVRKNYSQLLGPGGLAMPQAQRLDCLPRGACRRCSRESRKCCCLLGLSTWLVSLQHSQQDRCCMELTIGYQLFF